MAAKFVLKKAKGGQFMFNLFSANGKVVLTSERYKSKASAVNGIKSVKKCAKADKNFDRGKTRSGGACFVLRAANGEPVGRSQTYKGHSGCAGGVASVKRVAPGASIDDQT